MKSFIGILSFMIISVVSKAQINFDFTDSLVNQQKQYIIRFNVANGNIYVPVKKKINSNLPKTRFFKNDLIKLKDSVLVPLFKDTILDGRIVKWKYALEEMPNPELKSKRGSNRNRKNQEDTFNYSHIRYLIGGRYLKPRVGSYIRLIFENVPKNMDVDVTAEFLDKNLENASTFEGFLNRYQTSLDTSVAEEAASFTKTINEQKNQAKTITDSLKQRIKDSIDKTSRSISNNLTNLNAEVTSLNGVTSKDKDSKPIEIDLKGTILKLQEAQNSLSNLPDSIKNDSLLISFIKDFKSKYIDGVLSDISKKLDENIDSKYKSLKHLIDKSTTNFTNLLDAMDSNIISFYKLQTTTLSLNDSLNARLAFILDSISNRRTVYIQPIQIPNNDISLLKINYKTSGESDKNVYREIMLKNKFGFKLDFSTGFIGTGLLDSSYRIAPTPGTVRDTARIIPDQKGDFAIGFALLAHAYFRTGGRINFAINSGLMLNGSNQTINYLAGLSLPLGLEERFIISGGLAYGKVKRLTGGYEPNKDYPADILNLSSGVPYTDKWKKSWYIGFSYNLSSLTSSSHKIVVAK